MTRHVLHSPSPTACAAMPTISPIVGTFVGANLTFGRRICLMSHSALTSVRPSSESYGGSKYGRGAQRDDELPPASAIAFSHASIEYAPSVLSMETPSQRRSTGEWPKPATATFPRCSQTP